MGLLYERYSSPMELMTIYINRGRFGEFVSMVLNQEYERRVDEAKKENDRMLWEAYIHSFSDESFEKWKKRVLSSGGGTTGKDASMTAKDQEELIQKLFGKQNDKE